MSVPGNFQGGDDSDDDDEFHQSNLSEPDWKRLLTVFPPQRNRKYEVNIFSDDIIVLVQQRDT